MSKTQDAIEALCQERQVLWSEGRAQEAIELGKRIDALYEKKRHDRAEHGSELLREAVRKRAKVEDTIDRLMSEP